MLSAPIPLPGSDAQLRAGGSPQVAASAMSIAVMNWVWASSPTSGNERLVLLALADACSRDDGTGCWPSAATIARKANISDRTVRRVIARLEAEGQVVVHARDLSPASHWSAGRMARSCAAGPANVTAASSVQLGGQVPGVLYPPTAGSEEDTTFPPV
jgi:hypothetical protein